MAFLNLGLPWWPANSSSTASSLGLGDTLSPKLGSGPMQSPTCIAYPIISFPQGDELRPSSTACACRLCSHQQPPLRTVKKRKIIPNLKRFFFLNRTTTTRELRQSLSEILSQAIPYVLQDLHRNYAHNSLATGAIFKRGAEGC